MVICCNNYYCLSLKKLLRTKWTFNFGTIATIARDLQFESNHGQINCQLYFKDKN